MCSADVVNLNNKQIESVQEHKTVARQLRFYEHVYIETIFFLRTICPWRALQKSTVCARKNSVEYHLWKQWGCCLHEWDPWKIEIQILSAIL